MKFIDQVFPIIDGGYFIFNKIFIEFFFFLKVYVNN